MNIILEGLQQAAAWAWHTSLAAALPVFALLALGYWAGFPARGRLFLGALIIVRLLMPMVPELPGHPAGWLQTSKPVESATIEFNEINLMAEASQHVNLWMWAAIGWGLGVLGVAAWLCHSQFALQRMINHEARPADPALDSHLSWAQERMGITKRIRIIEITRMPTVALWGWFRPRIIVPSGLLEKYSADEVRGMFLHELAHVRRHDVLWMWLGLAACALHWFNPLAWLALRRFRMDREIDCDRLALDVLNDPQRHSYGLALLKTLETHLAPAPVALVPFGQTQPNIQTRIRMITHPLPTRLIHRLGLLIIPSSAILIFTAAQADGERKEGDKPRAEQVGDRPKEGARDGEARKPATRDGDERKPAVREGARDGDVKKEGARDGEARRPAARDGEERKPAAREGARDGEVKKEGARDGEARRPAARDGEERKPAAREGARDEEVKKEGARDGEARRPAARDGEERKPAAREGARDGEVKKEGARDGEARRPAARDGEERKPAAREGARDGEVKKEGARDGEARRQAIPEGGAAREAARADAAARDAAAARGAAATREAAANREGSAPR